ncbi:retrovirus-related pol polyprotein from transposon TNT 1-94 [Tanacetum coccineum]
MHNNSQGKKQQVEDHHRNFKFSNNKTSVTACNDSLNAKTSNVNFVCVTCGKCVLNYNHDMYVLHYINGVNTRTQQPIVVPINTRKPKRTVNQSIVTPPKKIVDAESTNQKLRNKIRKQYEHASKTCRWCSKHMTGNLKLLSNFVEKFLGTVKFGTDQIAPIIGSRGTYLYSITLQDTFTPNPICLMAKATSSQAWLWHCRLSHLNFDTINLLLKYDIMTGLTKLKFVKDYLCSSCELGKAKRKSFKTKTTLSIKQWLQILHMVLCGPMRVESFNGKKYMLVIINDYSRYTWTHFLRSKYETLEVLIDFLKLVQRGLHAQIRTVRTNKGTEFLNLTLHAYFAQEAIEHQTSTAQTPKQNDVVERRNRTLVEATRTMLSVPKVPLFFWAEAIATASKTVTTSNELYLIFSLMFDELLNGTTLVVSKSSTVTATDAPNQRQQQNTNLSTSTIVVADIPPLNIQTTPETTNQAPTQAPTITVIENINQAETDKENEQVEEDEFINIFSTPVQEQGETSSRYVNSYGYIKNHMKTVKNKQARTRERKSEQKPEAKPGKSSLSHVINGRSTKKHEFCTRSSHRTSTNVTSWIASLAIHVNPKDDQTATNQSQMIGKMEGGD